MEKHYQQSTRATFSGRFRLKSIPAKPHLVPRSRRLSSDKKAIIPTARFVSSPLPSHFSSSFEDYPYVSSRNVIELSAKYFDPQRKLRKEYLMNTIEERFGQRSSDLYLDFVVDLTELQLKFGKKVKEVKWKISSTDDFRYHSTLEFLCEVRSVSFLVKQSQLGCSVSERTIRSFCEAFCSLSEICILLESVDLSNCTLRTQVALLHTLLSESDITFSQPSYSTKLVCIFSNDFFHLKENEFMSIIHMTKPLVVQGEISKTQFQELIFYSFLSLTEYNEKIARALMEAGVDINMTDKDGKKPLFYVIDRNNEKISCALIEAGADIKFTDKDGKTPLIYATDRNNEKISRALIEAGADVNMTDKDGKTALFYVKYNENITHALIEAGADVNMTDKDGKTALFYVKYNEKIKHALIEAGAEVNMTDKDGKTALFNATDNDNERIARALIVADAAVNIADKDSKTALFYATDKDNEKVAHALTEAGDDVNMTDKDGKTALFYATDRDDEKKAHALIEAGADVNMTDNDGKTALFYATDRDNEKIAHALIEAGADVNMTDKDGKTALFYATDRDNEKIAHALIEAGADVNIKDKEGNTVLLCVFRRRNNNRMCKILLEAGSSLCETTRKQETVFHLALNICQQNILSSPWHTILDAFKLFSEPSESKVAVNKRDVDLNSPLHLWASLVLASPSHQYREDVFDKYSFERMLNECLELLVKCGIKLNYSNKQEQTPLHVCRTWTAVKLLLDAGAKPDVTDSSGCTPLLAAANRNTCIEKGSKLFYPDVTQTPKEFWKDALDKKLDPWTADENGNSVLSILVTKGANILAKALVEIACELKCIQSDAVGAPLLFAICRDKSVDKEWKVDLVKTLLKNRNSLAQKRASDEDTALHVCCRTMVELHEDSAKISVHWKIAQHLILCGADIETPGKKGHSCLDIAESCPVAKRLLSMPVKMGKVHPVMDSWKKVSVRHQEQLVRVSRGFNFKQIDTVCHFNESLDNGTFGLVFVGINTQDGKEVAVKRVERMRVNEESTLRELEELRGDISCNNIIQCLLCTSDKDFLYVILELMEGNLDDLLSDDEKNSHISQEPKLCRDICTGLDFLHNRDIVHKGIKPSNILYQVLPSGINLKLAFFGLRSQMTKEQHVSDYTDTYECLIKERCWMAPEVLQSQSHSKSSDVFSCGLVIHYLLSSKKHPFGDPGSSKESLLAVSIETVDNIAQDKMKLDETLSSDSEDLLKGMLCNSALRRTSISNALKHWFFQSKPENT